MSSGQHLKYFISERLTAAAAEIFSEFEKTILQYEEVIDRQRRLLDSSSWKPELKLHRVELQQDPVHEIQILSEQQLWKQKDSLAQPPWIKEERDDPEPAEIKAEEEELCTGEEEDQLHLNLLTSLHEDHSEPEPDREPLISHSSAGPEDLDQDSGSNEMMDHMDRCHGEGVIVRPEEEGPVEESTAEDARDGSRGSQNPWSYLEDYFVLMSRDKSNTNILCFRCVLCQPKDVTIKGQVTSFYNLKSHVRRKHPAHSIQFEELVKANSSRGKHKRCFGSQGLQPYAKRARQFGIGEAFSQSGSGGPQSKVDKRIVELFGNDTLSLHVVQSPTFIGLIKMLNPNETSTSCCTLSGRIMASQKELEEYLTRPPTGPGPQDETGSNRPAALQPEEELHPGPEEARTSAERSGGGSAPPAAED